MKRTQLYIDMETYQLALNYARRIGTTISELARIGLRTQLPGPVKTSTFTSLIQFAKKHPAPEGTPSDISTNPDAYLYTKS